MILQILLYSSGTPTLRRADRQRTPSYPHFSYHIPPPPPVSFNPSVPSSVYPAADEPFVVRSFIVNRSVRRYSVLSSFYRPSIHPSTRPSVRLPSNPLRQSVHPSICLLVRPSVFLLITPSVRPSVSFPSPHSVRPSISAYVRTHFHRNDNPTIIRFHAPSHLVTFHGYQFVI